MKDFGFNMNEKSNSNNSDILEKSTEKKLKIPTSGFVTNCYLVNVRKQPSKDATVIGTLSKGCKVTITGDKTAGFYPVRFSTSIDGFINADFLEVT